MDERIGRHLLIVGRVQGVGYRAWLAACAREAGLDGWVRNCRDGAVEALLTGPRSAVERVLERCGEGPPLARVTAVETRAITELPPPGFAVRPTV